MRTIPLYTVHMLGWMLVGMLCLLTSCGGEDATEGIGGEDSDTPIADEDQAEDSHRVCSDDDQCRGGTVCLNGVCVTPGDEDEEIHPGGISVPQLLVFGYVSKGTFKEKNVEVANVGKGTLTLTKVSLSNDTSEEFVLMAASNLNEKILPGEKYTLTLGYAPRDLGPDTGSLIIESSDPENPRVFVALRAEYGGTPDIVLFIDGEAVETPEDARLDFGALPIDDESEGEEKCFSVKNVPKDNETNQAIRIDDVYLVTDQDTDFWIVDLPEFPCDLVPGNELQVCVGFNPTQMGTHEEQLIIVNDDPDVQDQRKILTLTGQAGAPDVEVFPDFIDFGGRSTNQQHKIPVEITNSGLAKLTISEIYVPDEYEGTFFISPATLPQIPAEGLEITPENHVPLDIVFLPVDETTYQGQLVVVSDDPDEGTLRVPIAGQGIFSRLSYDPSTLDFGEELVGNSKTKTLEISNLADFATTIIMFDMPEGCYFGVGSETTLPLTLQAQQRRLVYLTYAPLEIGNHQVQVDVRTQDGAPTPTLTLTGRGIKPELYIDPIGPDIDFGQVTRNRTKHVQMTLYNFGDTLMEVTSVTVSNQEPPVQNNEVPVFYVADSSARHLAFSVPANDQHAITITFQPLKTVDYTADLTIETNDANNPTIEYRLSGTGISPSMKLSTYEESEEPDDILPGGLMKFTSCEIDRTSAPVYLLIENAADGELIVENLLLNSYEVFKIYSMKTLPDGVEYDTIYDALPISIWGEGDEGVQGLELKLAMTPYDQRTFHTRMTIESNDVAYPEVYLNLQGEGVQCQGGMEDCDLNEPGCDTYVLNDANNCGSCGFRCEENVSYPHVESYYCYEGECLPDTCENGWDDCLDGEQYEGCETNVIQDPYNCGGCRIACSSYENRLPHVSIHDCEEGLCIPRTCEDGWGDCFEGEGMEGCETRIAEAIDHCGQCDFNCEGLDWAHVRVFECREGQCRGAECDTGYGDCLDGENEEGCETDLRDTVAHCGQCENSCNSLPHVAYDETQPEIDGAVCEYGRCVDLVCEEGWGNCIDDGAGENPDALGCETNLFENLNHCGACDFSCTATENHLPHTVSYVCDEGVCKPQSCASGWADCLEGADPDSGESYAGCETYILDDVEHCGNCAHACDLPNVEEHACIQGNCTIVECLEGWSDCFIGEEGCETETGSDLDHCGACNHRCQPPHDEWIENKISNLRCLEGSCEKTCMVGYEDCDTSTVACESVGLGALNRCGSCDNDCSARNWANVDAYACNLCTGEGDTGYSACRDYCEAQGTLNLYEAGGEIHECYYCSIARCETGYDDCNDEHADGCEINLMEDPLNCNRCGTVCDLPNTSEHGCSEGVCTIKQDGGSGQYFCDSGYGNCDGADSNGCEIDVTSNTDHCGSCGNDCENLPWPHVQRYECTAGQCVATRCAFGWEDCLDGDGNEGCETNISDDDLNCGDCGIDCSEEDWECGDECRVVNYSCEYGTCQIETCEIGFKDCNGDPEDGCETSLLEPYTCGGCVGDPGRKNCLTENWFNVETLGCWISPDSGNYDCMIETCAGGYGNCNGIHNSIDGCETNLSNDVYNCGSCENVCILPHATPVCNTRVCQIATDATGAERCEEGYENCNENDDDGCEVHVAGELDNCGSCGNDCSQLTWPQVTSYSCNLNQENWRCEIASCEQGYDHCSVVMQNGCETNIYTNMEHCGACDTLCELENADEACQTGNCIITSCNNGWDDCNHTHSDGCEIHISQDVNNCGECGHVCNLPHASSICTNSACAIDECQEGYKDCNGLASDGCEVRLADDVNNCGDCNIECEFNNAIPICQNRICRIGSCEDGWSNCDSNEYNGCEAHTAVDPNRCGSCDHVCVLPHATEACSDGQCTIASCDDGYEDCNGITSDGCEINTLTNVLNCGGCGDPCPSYDHASARCSNGYCYIDDCDSGWENCNNQAGDGCETNITQSDDGTHCGSCSFDCSSKNWPDVAEYYCVNSGCMIALCNEGYGNCDGTKANGCEADFNLSEDHCGGCDSPCDYVNATEHCESGSCTLDSCNGNYGDCNGNLVTDGCEVDLSNNSAHCGACDNLCSVETKPYATGVTCTTDNCAGIACCHATSCELPLELQDGECICVGTVNCDCDDFELDNRMQDAGELTLNQTAYESHSICPAGDKDWFSFELTEDLWVQVELKMDLGSQLYMALYSSEGVELNSYTFVGNGDVKIPWTVMASPLTGEEDGTIYYLYAKSYVPPESIGEYKFRVQTFAP